METLRVALGSRAYPVHIGAGIIDDASLYRAHLGAGKAAVVTDHVVAPLYLERVARALRAAGAQVVEVVVQGGEGAKAWQPLDGVFDALLAARCGRDSLIVALGGGVIGDLAGFAAAVYQRGVPYLQVPTTLLAQVDSSVGGKTAINHARGKNLVGAFHQPRAVIADVAALGSLPQRELRAGLAEVIKHGLIRDRAFLDWLEANLDKLLAKDPAALALAVKRSIEIKSRVVEADEREAGERALLNFGHTFGHAIEAGTGFGEWLHGEAVAAGMAMAAELSARAGMIGPAEVKRVRELLRRANLPTEGPAIDAERLIGLMQVDKKAARGRNRFILLESLGKAVIREEVDERWVREAIAACAPAIAAAH